MIPMEIVIFRTFKLCDQRRKPGRVTPFPDSDWLSQFSRSFTRLYQYPRIFRRSFKHFALFARLQFALRMTLRKKAARLDLESWPSLRLKLLLLWLRAWCQRTSINFLMSKLIAVMTGLKSLQELLRRLSLPRLLQPFPSSFSHVFIRKFFRWLIVEATSRARPVTSFC